MFVIYKKKSLKDLRIFKTPTLYKIKKISMAMIVMYPLFALGLDTTRFLEQIFKGVKPLTGHWHYCNRFQKLSSFWFSFFFLSIGSKIFKSIFN